MGCSGLGKTQIFLDTLCNKKLLAIMRIMYVLLKICPKTVVDNAIEFSALYDNNFSNLIIKAKDVKA